MGRIYIIGTGMNAVNDLSQKAKNVLSQADVIIGAKRMTDMVTTDKSNADKKVFNEYIAENITDILLNNDYETAAVLMSGDTGLYSGTEKLLTMLVGKGLCAEIIPCISSVQYLSAKTNIPWQKFHILSLHGSKGSPARTVSVNEYTFMLCGTDSKPQDICRKLCEYGLENIKVYIGENLGGENERIVSGAAKDFADEDFSVLSVVLAENPEYERYVRTAISDDEFIREKVPMTKSVVRGYVISQLEIEKNSICWDIGSGTGSVTVEMAMRAYDGFVYAVEKKTEACELTAKNLKKFHCDNVEVICGDAVETVCELPSPDVVFIGGSGGELDSIIAAARKKNPKVKIVLTAVTIETLYRATEGYDCEVIQIGVNRFETVGNSTLTRAENPVYVIRLK